ncbi:uncharacterized protein LOC114406426 isoform X1 [Glycine soja]|uniref:Uncharacterized protein n=2 Tax=Glycine soja TaxID=3848 RepID=A0A0B2NU08_GLYSO|nr:uncharacterized protein LOC114406426 isoform X1 [Glycine soja]XP_028224924.1 uncharacterized protein LOC114406426 isoform X1 [Glycine soja]KHM98981.1 hypothetical protein glysoja_044011 [Glycine soja]RZC19958.1 hypothetical protein D0Y65_006698 [Glycine soja]
MEVELEPRVKALPFKVKAMSRESPSQKALHVLDTDLRTHWSTATNTKEWILLELDEPCLLSHIRIYNKSVLEWEIAVGLRYKPEIFQKVRPRCEAPRRDMIYPTNYTPCRYVRISCLRGNPIAIFFVQLIGVPVAGLEPEFQPVVNYLLPSILSHKQDPHDIHLQLLQDMTSRLLVFLPQLETDLSSFPDSPESNLRFLAMLAGPLYPILHVVNERTTSKPPGNITDLDVSKSSQLSPTLTVSTNFEPRRSRSASPLILSAYRAIVFRPDAIFVLLRKAYKDSDLGSVCRMASRIMQKLINPDTELDVSKPQDEVTSLLEDKSNLELSSSFTLVDYSKLLGEEFQMPDEQWDCSYLNILDMGAVEEGILHVLYSCASQPVLCSKLAERSSDFWAAVPLVQALLPALRPWVSNSFDVVDDTFSQWKQPIVQQALSQIVATATSGAYRSLVHACAGYLSSYSPSHARAACVLIDLCSGVLAPWMTQVIAKVDLALELLEDLLGIIQDAHNSLVRARAALKYIVLALSGHMDDILGKYKEVKHKILFLVEMLEPFLDPGIAVPKSKIAFGDIASSFPEKQEHNCTIALNIIRTAVRKPAVLPSLESEWRHGSVAPSVLLSILEPHMLLPPDVDLCKSVLRPTDHETASISHLSSAINGGGAFSKSNGQDESDGKTNVSEMAGKSDFVEDRNLLFAPQELQSMTLTNFSNIPDQNSSVSNIGDISLESKHVAEKHASHHFPTNILDAGLGFEYFNLQADYFQLLNYHDCELRASEFRRLALDLHSQNDVSVESHDAAIDAMLLAAECHVNPYFMLSIGASSKLMDLLSVNEFKVVQSHDKVMIKKASGKNKPNLETIAHIERKRDKLVFQILLEAAELDRKYHLQVSNGEDGAYSAEGFDEQVIKLSPLDVQYADALTLVRQNQALLCNFLIQQLQGDQISMHEILLQSLVYFLHTGTKLCCPPEHVIDIILKYAEDLNKLLTSFHHPLREGSLHLTKERMHGVERRWLLLQRLVIAASGGGEEQTFGTNVQNNYLCGNLIPSSAWMQRISHFSGSLYPLVRFLGWMAISRNAKQYMKDRIFLASDLSQLTYLLSIFADDLAVVDDVVNKKYEEVKIEDSRLEHSSSAKREFERGNQCDEERSFCAIYPELWKFFPNMKRQFKSFGEAILEAVGLQLRSVSSTLVPDVLCWFSELCLWPFSFASSIGSNNLKGYNAKNARAIILYILEAIIVEHMEAMVPETPKLVQVLVSLSSSTYCDVSFLDSVLRLLKPIISYSLSKISHDEKLLDGDSCLNFEELCFNILFMKLKQKSEIEHSSEDKEYNTALAIFILASIFPDLSIRYRREFLQSLLKLANFAAFAPTTSFFDYLSAFQCVMDNCKLLLVNALTEFGVIPLQLPPYPHGNVGGLSDDNLKPNPWFLSDVCCTSCVNDVHNVESNNSDVGHFHLPSDDLEGFSKDIEGLISELNPAIECCWNLHHQISRKLTIASAECFVFSKCLTSLSQKFHKAEDDDQNSSPTKSSDIFTLHWRFGLQGLCELIVMLQERSCWEVSCLMLDCLLGVTYSFCLDGVVGIICSTIKNVSCSAPKISWRLRSDKWLSSLIARGIYNSQESEVPLIDLFCTLLAHAEPEQRIIAVKHLGILLGQCTNGERAVMNFKICTDFIQNKLVLSIPDYVLSRLVSSTWDEVVVLASSDLSLQLRIHAMALLSNYIPFAERHHLQSFLVAADSICCLCNAQPSQDGPILQLSLALIAYACLYSPAEDISLIPQNLWENVETLGSTKHDGKLGDLEKRTCQVLCRLRDEGDEAKEALKEVLSQNSSKQYDPDFANTRESVVQVLGNLTAVHSYFDLFTRKIDQDDMELEEAELELDIIQKEHALPGRMDDSKDWNQIPGLPSYRKDVSRLQQIRECIRSLEKSKLKEDIIARRQKKLLMRHARQKHLEEAALREADLLQELDRERTAEMEKELERQRLLEIERAKTKELRHNLDMEKERQTQRELQREIEQAESGLRPSRRDFPSSSRPRDRFRERENGRSGNEGSIRAGSGSLQPEIPSTSSSMAPLPTIVLSGSRTLSGQLPTILQSRDRQDDTGSMYEENVDGSKDSGDTGSIGDPELVSAFDGQPGGYGSQRHSSRGSKSRQLGERRDRDSRREGKWERKH